MGNVLTGCGKKEMELIIENLNIQIKASNKTIQLLRLSIDQLNESNDLLNQRINEMTADQKILDDQITHVNNLLGNSDELSEVILNSDLNCAYMDNAKEKEYLMSIIEFLHIACSDVRLGVNDMKKKHKKLKNKPPLDRMDTVDKILAEIDDSSTSK